MSKAYQNTIASFAITLGAFSIFEKAYVSEELVMKIKLVKEYASRLVREWPTRSNWEETVQKVDKRFREWEEKHLPQEDVNPLLITSSVISILGDLSINLSGERRDKVNRLFDLVVDFNNAIEGMSQTSPEIPYRRSVDLAGSFLEYQNR